LADYNIWDEVTVYFGNDKVTVDPQYDSKLLALCHKATIGFALRSPCDRQPFA